MFALALVGSVILLVGAFPAYTSRPDLFSGIDSPASPGGLASIAAGIAAIAICWNERHSHHLHALVALGVPAGFTALQLLASVRLMRSVAQATGERVLPGLGLLLSVTGGGITGFVAEHAAHVH